MFNLKSLQQVKQYPLMMVSFELLIQISTLVEVCSSLILLSHLFFSRFMCRFIESF
jgi:hypothetical protein